MATAATSATSAARPLGDHTVPSSTVVQAITSTDRRGAEVFAVDLGAALGRLGWSVATVALAPGAVGGLDVPTWGAGPLRPQTLWRLRRDAKHSGVVVGHGSKTLLAGAVALGGVSTPFVYRSIGDPAHWSLAPSRRARVKWALSRTARVVVLWPSAARYLVDHLGVRTEQVRVVPNAVDASRFPLVDPAARKVSRALLRVRGDGPVVSYIGALTPEKSVATAIDAVGQLPDAQLLIAGGGPDESMLRARAAASAPDRVLFLGSVADPQRVLAAADALVLPSVTEGIPAVLIEAGLSGLPVVATSVGGNGEVVADGETGVLVPPGDSGALAEGLVRALGDGERLGAAAREHCLARFALDVVAPQWATVLQEVVR